VQLIPSTLKMLVRFAAPPGDLAPVCPSLHLLSKATSGSEQRLIVEFDPSLVGEHSEDGVVYSLSLPGMYEDDPNRSSCILFRHCSWISRHTRNAGPVRT
jgi:hypothetical protein